MRTRLLIAVLAGCVVALASPAGGPDPVKVDPSHYRVETDNPQVRVLRVHYGPHEKSVMHAHPATVAVFLTDGDAQFSYPDGRKEKVSMKAGQVTYAPATVHLPENLSDKPFDVIVIELKGPAPKASAGTKKK
jgi:quercetin dioxygenase-like cupin family protein